MIRIAIVQFPGSNCERETAQAVLRAGMQPEDFFWQDAPDTLAQYDGFILAGGFSYEDRSRAGIIAALDPVMQHIAIQADLGKPVLGICNGAQILVESGLVPGVSVGSAALALTDNQRMQDETVIGTGFYNDWVHVRVADDEPLTAFTRKVCVKDILKMPVAHAEGRFVIPPVLLDEMQRQGMRVFQYCDALGELTPSFPVNPNGSIDNIAAISNRAGNVLAMMPHPERTPNGDPIFQSMREYIEVGHVQQVRPLKYTARSPAKRPYPRQADHHELIIGLQITDNQAVSVQMAFELNGVPVTIRRYTHWELTCDANSPVVEAVLASGLLFNPRKERLLKSLPAFDKTHAVRLLVQANDDHVGKKRLQQLQQRFGIEGLRGLRQGVLWHIETDPVFLETVLASSVFYNPYSHIAWVY